MDVFPVRWNIAEEVLRSSERVDCDEAGCERCD